MLRRTALLLALVPILATSAPFAQDERSSYDSGDPSALEQYLLELVNRARMDPEAERVRLGISAGDWPGYPPRPPLAMDARLLDAARSHAADMAYRRFFAYVNPDGEGSNGRVRKSGFPLSKDYGADGDNQVETIRAQGPDGVASAHRALLENRGSTTLALRRLILSDGLLWESNDQAGIGVVAADVKFDRRHRYAEFFVQEFAHDDDPTPFVLGVVYRDGNGNGLYDPGEGLGGVSVETEDGAFRTITGTAGGYAFPVGRPGEFTLLAAGGDLAVPANASFAIGGENVKVDFRERVELPIDVVKSSFKVNFAARSKGSVNSDSYKLKAVLSAEGIPPEVLGAPVTMTIGDYEIGPVVPTVKGRNAVYKSASGVFPKVVMKLKGKKGLMVLKVSKADLAEGLGVDDAGGTPSKEIFLRVRLGEPFSASAAALHRLKIKLGRKASGVCRY